MRQFNCKYKSSMSNEHGFATFIPDERFFHPLVGMTGAHGEPNFQTKNNPGYSIRFSNIFMSKKYYEIKHKVKMYFPEIRNGAVYVSDAKYGIKSGSEDEVNVTYEISRGDAYKEYTQIKNFIAEFEITIKVDFGKCTSIVETVEIYCEYVDVYVYDQRIRISIHDNSSIFIPYIISYRKDLPPEIALRTSGIQSAQTNTDLEYGFILNEEPMLKLKELGFTTDEIDVSILDIVKMREKGLEYIQTDFANNALESTSPFTNEDRIGKKYIVSIPAAVFPSKMTLRGIPVFDSDIIMQCCDIRKASMCSPYLKMYGVALPDTCPPPSPCNNQECIDQPQYEVRNKVIDGYMILSDLNKKDLDDLYGKVIIANGLGEILK